MPTNVAAASEPATLLIITSDERNPTVVGARGLWGKSTMYRESVGVPLILRGQGIESGRVDDTSVSHLDGYNTVLDCVGVPLSANAQSASLCDPIEIDRRAKARQAELIELFGGEQAIRNGDATGGHTPVPAH